ncbi:CLUMA_CG014750, isoform A [Clunio marinus]|uniref:CLUMA_CG014750, isoform A n=1 Tax=Clunio marinus TaxID=568069 RepID=A0A1J1IPF7_9DIPT|nr:CLUMA_CG014750, isoform A [Clunio marinus]
MFVEAEIKLHVIYTTAEEKIDLCCPSTTPFNTQISSPTDQVVAHLMVSKQQRILKKRKKESFLSPFYSVKFKLVYKEAHTKKKKMREKQ